MELHHRSKEARWVTLLSWLSVRGAKVRADLVLAHIVPQYDAKKWRNSVPVVLIASVCCTCVPTLLPLLLAQALSREDFGTLLLLPPIAVPARRHCARCLGVI